MSTMYSKLTDCMTESSQTNRTMRDSLKKLSEIYVLLSCCIDNNRPEGHSLSFQVDDQSCHDHLKTNLERSISHVQELSQKLSDEFARLCGILHSLSHENSVFLHQILTLSRELPSPIREKCVRQICDLEALENWQEVETDSTGITKEMAHLEVYQRRSQLLNVASLRFSNELIAALLQLQKDHQVDLQYQHSQLEAMYQKMMSDLQDSHSLDLTAAKVPVVLTHSISLCLRMKSNP